MHKLHQITIGLVALVMLTSGIAPAYAVLDLIPDGVFSGNVGVSSDGCGTNSPPCSISQDVISGATIVKAYLYATTTSSTPATLDIELDGVTKTLAALPENDNAGFGTYRADVTTDVATALGGDSSHVFTVDESVAAVSTGSIEGVALVIVYSHPSLPLESSVLIFDGGLESAPPQQTFFYGNPVDVDDPDFAAEMRLGISYSAQDQGGSAGLTHCGGDSDMDSNVDVNAVRLTSCAGNQDDGVGTVTNGVLFTIGGVGDDLLNPSDPLQSSGAGATSEAIDDDERYDISGFISDGDISMTLDTINQSNDDFIWLSILAFQGIQVDVEPPILVGGTLLPLDTTALLINGLFVNSFWMLPVIGIAGVTVFYLNSRRN